MSEYYMITENFMNNSSSIVIDDRSEYFEDIDNPIVSITSEIISYEEESINHTKDFHFFGEIYCNDKIAMILSKYNPYRLSMYPSKLDDRKGYNILSLSNIISCADLNKSEIISNPFYPGQNKVKVMELYLDIKKLASIPKYKRQIFVISEAHDRVIVSKELGKDLLEYLSKNSNSSLMIKPISEDGKVPELF